MKNFSNAQNDEEMKRTGSDRGLEGGGRNGGWEERNYDKPHKYKLSAVDFYHHHFFTIDLIEETFQLY